VPVSALFRAALRGIALEFASDLPALDLQDRMCVYENRDQLYIAALQKPRALYRALDAALSDWLTQHDAGPELVAHARAVLAIDAAFCPRVGAKHVIEESFEFDAARVAYHLNRMELPPDDAFSARASQLRIQHPGGVGEVLKDPDGGSWFRGQVQASHPDAEPAQRTQPAKAADFSAA
jgi:hypothetical protein